MICMKHPLRKRKDCPSCITESGTTFSEETVIKPEIIKKPKQIKKAKVTIPKKEEPIEIIEIKKEETPIDLNKILKDEISDFIRKEVKKAVALFTEELISEEARESAKKVANEAMDKAAESYKWKVKELSDISYEHLAIPLGVFRVSLLDKLSSEGWKMIQTITGECAKVSGYKTDVILFSRVKNQKWPKAPQY